MSDAGPEFRLGDLRLEVEQRPFALGADGGPCLRVRDSEGREWLRFDPGNPAARGVLRRTE